MASVAVQSAIELMVLTRPPVSGNGCWLCQTRYRMNSSIITFSGLACAYAITLPMSSMAGPLSGEAGVCRRRTAGSQQWLKQIGAQSQQAATDLQIYRSSHVSEGAKDSDLTRGAAE